MFKERVDGGYLYSSFRSFKGRNTDERIEGTVYIIDGKEYLVEDEGIDGESRVFFVGYSRNYIYSLEISREEKEKMFDVPERQLTADEDLEVLQQIQDKVENDRRVEAGRAEYAKKQSSDDAALAQIILWHIEFTDGRPCEPEHRDGVDFYQVGRNATHQFYVGTKDGKKYKMCSYMDYVPVTEEQKNDPKFLEEHGLNDFDIRKDNFGVCEDAPFYYDKYVEEVEEVEEFGYVGHF